MLRDHQLLICRYDVERDAAVRGRYERFLTRVGARVERDAEPCELLRHAGPQGDCVLADSGCEYEGVQPAESGSQHARIEADTIDEVIERESSLRVGTRLQLANVIADAGEPFQTAFVIE